MRSLLLVVALSAAMSSPVAGAESDIEVSRQMFSELLGPVTEAAAAVDASGIAVRGLPAKPGPEQRFFEEVGDRFLAGGFDVWVLKDSQPVPEGVLALDLALTNSEIDYPEQTRTFFGIGQARVQRRVTLGAHMRLTDPAAGRIVYNAEPVLVQREWMSFSEAFSHAEGRPDWMGAAPIQDMRTRNPWWQRGLVVGIVAGVAAIYFSGAS